MPQVDATLKVHTVGSHVICADQVIDAATWSADCCHDVITGHNRMHICAYLNNATKRLMSCDKEIVTIWGLTIFGSVDLLVSSVHANAQHLDQNATTIWNVCH